MTKRGEGTHNRTILENQSDFLGESSKSWVYADKWIFLQGGCFDVFLSPSLSLSLSVGVWRGPRPKSHFCKRLHCYTGTWGNPAPIDTVLRTEVSGLLADDYCAVRCGARLLLPHYAYEYTGQGPNSGNGEMALGPTHTTPNPNRTLLKSNSNCPPGV